MNRLGSVKFSTHIIDDKGEKLKVTEEKGFGLLRTCLEQTDKEDRGL